MSRTIYLVFILLLAACTQSYPQSTPEMSLGDGTFRVADLKALPGDATKWDATIFLTPVEKAETPVVVDLMDTQHVVATGNGTVVEEIIYGSAIGRANMLKWEVKAQLNFEMSPQNLTHGDYTLRVCTTDKAHCKQKAIII